MFKSKCRTSVKQFFCALAHRSRVSSFARIGEKLRRRSWSSDLKNVLQHRDNQSPPPHACSTVSSRADPGIKQRAGRMASAEREPITGAKPLDQRLQVASSLTP